MVIFSAPVASLSGSECTAPVGNALFAAKTCQLLRESCRRHSEGQKTVNKTNATKTMTMRTTCEIELTGALLNDQNHVKLNLTVPITVNTILSLFLNMPDDHFQRAPVHFHTDALLKGNQFYPGGQLSTPKPIEAL